PPARALDLVERERHTDAGVLDQPYVQNDVADAGEQGEDEGEECHLLESRLDTLTGSPKSLSGRRLASCRQVALYLLIHGLSPRRPLTRRWWPPGRISRRRRPWPARRVAALWDLHCGGTATGQYCVTDLHEEPPCPRPPALLPHHPLHAQARPGDPPPS